MTSKKLMLLYIMLLLCMFIGAGCDEPSETGSPTSSAPATIEKRGNTASNIAGGGLAAIQDDWIYFYGHGTNDSINRVQINVDGSLSEPEQLRSLKEIKGAYYINVVDDYIYFNHDGLYRMRIDGSELTRLSPENETSASYISVMGDWIFYATNESLYKMHVDGSMREEIKLEIERDVDAVVPDLPRGYTVDGDWIYFFTSRWIDYSEAINNIYKIRTDGTEVTLLHSVNTVISSLIAEDGWIYYLQKNEGGSVYDETGLFSIMKMSSDGTTIKEIGEADSLYINIAENWMYYERYRLQYYPPYDAQQVLYTEEYALLRMNLEGQNIELIYDESKTGLAPGHNGFDTMILSRISSFWGPSIVGNWIMSLNNDQEVTVKNLGGRKMDTTTEITERDHSPHDGPLDGDPYDVIVDVPENNNLNLRSGPGENYEIIGKLPRGTVLMVMDTASLQAGSVWFEVSVYDTGAQGWVSADYVRDATYDDFTAFDVGWVEVDGLELRSGPGSGFDTLEYLAKDTMLLYKYGDEGVKSSDTGTLWLEVETPSGKAGWIQSGYLRRLQ